MIRAKLFSKYATFLLITFLLVTILVPLLFLGEIYLIKYLPENAQPLLSIQVGIADALTVATILGGITAFVMNQYQTELRDKRDNLRSGALRLILKHVREQVEPRTIDEHWRIFRDDYSGRKIYCENQFSNISFDQFSADIYALRFEGQIDLTHDGQVVPRIPFDVKVKKASLEERNKVIEVLENLASSGEKEFVRSSAISGLGEIKDAGVVEIVKKYLDDSNEEIRLEAARSLTKLVAFPED